MDGGQAWVIEMQRIILKSSGFSQRADVTPALERRSAAINGYWREAGKEFSRV